MIKAFGELLFSYIGAPPQLTKEHQKFTSDSDEQRVNRSYENCHVVVNPGIDIPLTESTRCDDRDISGSYSYPNVDGWNSIKKAETSFTENLEPQVYNEAKQEECDQNRPTQSIPSDSETRVTSEITDSLKHSNMPDLLNQTQTIEKDYVSNPTLTATTDQEPLETTEMCRVASLPCHSRESHQCDAEKRITMSLALTSSGKDRSTSRDDNTPTNIKLSKNPSYELLRFSSSPPTGADEARFCHVANDEDGLMVLTLNPSYETFNKD